MSGIVCAKRVCDAYAESRAAAELAGWGAFINCGIVVTVCPDHALDAPEGWVRAAVRCRECGGFNGVHGFVHVRYGNGGGGNRPCSATRVERVP